MVEMNLKFVNDRKTNNYYRYILDREESDEHLSNLNHNSNGMKVLIGDDLVPIDCFKNILATLVWGEDLEQCEKFAQEELRAVDKDTYRPLVVMLKRGDERVNSLMYIPEVPSLTETKQFGNVYIPYELFEGEIPDRIAIIINWMDLLKQMEQEKESAIDILYL